MDARPRDLRSSGAFSLVELLVVIAVIGIVSMVAFPMISDFRGSAQESAIRVQEQQLNQSYRSLKSITPDLPTDGPAILAVLSTNAMVGIRPPTEMEGPPGRMVLTYLPETDLFAYVPSDGSTPPDSITSDGSGVIPPPSGGSGFQLLANPPTAQISTFPMAAIGSRGEEQTFPYPTTEGGEFFSYPYFTIRRVGGTGFTFVNTGGYDGPAGDWDLSEAVTNIPVGETGTFRVSQGGVSYGIEIVRMGQNVIAVQAVHQYNTDL